LILLGGIIFFFLERQGRAKGGKADMFSLGKSVSDHRAKEKGLSRSNDEIASEPRTEHPRHV
jgi:hypothetical protein